MSELSPLERLGNTMFVGTVCSALASLPAALRLAQTSGTFAGAWCLCAALAVLPLLVFVWLLRAARRGLRAFAGRDVGARVAALAGWLVVMALVLDWLGETMRARTHHHALAGATYALVLLAAGIVSALAFARVAALLALGGRTRLIIVAAAIALGAVVVALRLRAGLALADPATRATLVDMAALAVGAILGAAAPPLPRLAARAGPLLLVLLLVLGWRASVACNVGPDELPFYGGGIVPDR